MAFRQQHDNPLLRDAVCGTKDSQSHQNYTRTGIARIFAEFAMVFRSFMPLQNNKKDINKNRYVFMRSGSYRQQTDYVLIRKPVLLQNFESSYLSLQLIMFQWQYENAAAGQGNDNSPLPDEHGFVVLNA